MMQIPEWVYGLLHPRTKLEEALLDQLRERIRELPPLPVSSGAAKEWSDFREKLRRAILTRDPRRFLTWNVIRSTMFFEGHSAELEALERSPAWVLWKKGVVESAVGSPPGNPLMPKTSGNLIHHAYSLLQFTETFGVHPGSLRSVFEFGGGYGSTARLLRQLGFNGSYAIYDFPEFLYLQEFYLRSLGLAENVTFLSNLGSAPRSPDLFIATWSLSESPVADRERALAAVSDPRYVLIGYQDRFADVDNAAYFAEFAKQRPQYVWKTLPIPHLPGNAYLLGKRV